MFKKLLHAAFALFLFAASAQAQVNYTFSAVSGTFTPVSGATAATLSPNCGYFPTVQGDEGFMNAIPTGFPFSYNGVTYSAINVATNGLASLGSGFILGATACSYDNTSGLTNNVNVTTGRPILAPFWDDLDVASIDYVTTGSSPNRVFTVQWTNAKWDYSATSACLSFQIKIYETTNVIEFIYRQDAGTPVNLSGGASIGITAVGSGSGNFMSLNNATAAPTVSTTTETTSIGTRPATGQVYRWTPVACPNPSINPTSANLCLGQIQQFTLSGGTVTAPQTFSNATSISIPAGAPATTSGNAGPYPSAITVSGLPTTGVTVKSVGLNGFSHTWPNDVDVVLVSPTGVPVIIMSDCGGGTGSVTTNQNFVFDDNAVNSMGTAGALVSGTYKCTNQTSPDNFPAPGPGNLTQGLNPTLSTFTGDMNGTWSLYIVDDVGGDYGSLSGGFTITFNVPAPLTGTFSPTVGLFTNSGGSTQYTGTSVSTIWAKPPATTTYTVTVINGSCNTSTNFTVTVANPPTFSTQPTAKTACELSNVSFTAATAAASTLQWQDSIPGIQPWTNITNATSGTYTITSVPLSYNNKYYRVLASAAPCAGVASNAVKLTVNALPLISLSASPYTRLYPGLTTTITATSTPSLTTGFTWFKNGVPVAGNNTNKINVNVDNQGVYTATVTDANGCTSLTSTELVIADSSRGTLFIIPNPNKGIFDVRYYSVTGNTLPRTLLIFDDKGSRIYVQEFTVSSPYQPMRVDLSRFKSGVYWLEVADRNGKRLKFGKVVVL